MHEQGLLCIFFSMSTFDASEKSLGKLHKRIETFTQLDSDYELICGQFSAMISEEQMARVKDQVDHTFLICGF